MFKVEENAELFAKYKAVADKKASMKVKPTTEPEPEPEAPPADGSPWVNFVECDGSKDAIKAWAVAKLGGSFGPNDDGKFAIRAHDATKGLYNLCLVYKQKMTLHNVRIAGAASSVGKKKFQPWTHVDQAVEELSSDPPPEGWPVRLTMGLNANTGELVGSSGITL